MLRQEVQLWQQAISEAIARADMAADAMAQPAWAGRQSGQPLVALQLAAAAAAQQGTAHQPLQQEAQQRNLHY